MNNDIDALTKELKDKILSLPETREYLRLEEIIENDKLLKGMRIEIAKLNAEGRIKERDNLLNEYNSVPLISNYNYLKEEIFNILNEVSKNLK